jgi:hypothetical protein
MQGQMGNWTFTKMMVKAQPTALMGVAAAFLHNEVRGTVILLLVNQSGGVTREWHRSRLSEFSGLGCWKGVGLRLLV